MFDSSRNLFSKKSSIRESVLDIASEGYVVNFLPREIDIAELSYQLSDKGALVFTDRKNFSLDINESGVNR